jgi:hypothetical protein
MEEEHDIFKTTSARGESGGGNPFVSMGKPREKGEGGLDLEERMQVSEEEEVIPASQTIFKGGIQP